MIATFFFELFYIFKIKNSYSHGGNFILVNFKSVVNLSLHSREKKTLKKIVHRVKDREMIKMSL